MKKIFPTYLKVLSKFSRMAFLPFFHYANFISDELIRFATEKTIEAVFLELGTLEDTLNAVAMTTVMRLVLSPILSQEPSPGANPMMGIKTIWELCLFQAGPFVSL